MKKTVLLLVSNLIKARKPQSKVAMRREHNDTLYFLRHGKAPKFTHPDDMTD